MQESTNESETEVDAAAGRDAAPSETAPATDQPRPSLAERLLKVDSSAGKDVRPAPPVTPRVADTRSPVSAPAAPPAASPAPARSWNSRVARFTPTSVEDALAEARRYIRLRYFIFLASIVVVFLVVVIVGIAFIASLLGGSDWEETGISGGVLAIAIALLVLLQYRPARSFALASSQLAQMEAAQTHMNRSFSFWERYLVEREESHQLTANDVAAAVTSLTAASSQMVSAQASLDAGPASASARRGRENDQGSRLPTNISPDPRRY